MCNRVQWPEGPRRALYHLKAPHCVEVCPAGVACNPRDASVKVVRTTIIPPDHSPTDDQPPPSQEGEAGVTPCMRQVRDGAGVRRRAREQLHTRKHAVMNIAHIFKSAHYHLP